MFFKKPHNFWGYFITKSFYQTKRRTAPAESYLQNKNKIYTTKIHRNWRNKERKLPQLYCTTKMSLVAKKNLLNLTCFWTICQVMKIVEFCFGAAPNFAGWIILMLTMQFGDHFDYVNEHNYAYNRRIHLKKDFGRHGFGSKLICMIIHQLKKEEFVMFISRKMRPFWDAEWGSNS